MISYYTKRKSAHLCFITNMRLRKEHANNLLIHACRDGRTYMKMAQYS